MNESKKESMKPLKRYIRDGYVTYYKSDEVVMLPDHYSERTKELRGVWFTTVGNTDFPKVTSVLESKAYLDNVVRTLKSYHMNAVMFHVRPMNDAFYPSMLAPWSRYATGIEGINPGYDILDYFIKACAKEKIEVHAWMNPYRVVNGLTTSKEEYLQKLPEENFARKHPSLVLETEKNALILDPASREVVSYVSSCAYEIAEKYDIKAIHMDDYFYPYDDIKDPDEERKFKASGAKSLGDFRRANVTKLIKAIHDKLGLLKKKVEFGISPFGIFRTNTKYAAGEEGERFWEKGSNNAPSCCSCYARLYADVYSWMKDGLIDYVVPQDYFDFDNYTKREDGSEVTIVQYADLARWWAAIARETGCKLYMGLGFYRYAKEGNWSNPEEIMNQLKYNQAYPEIKGAIMFTYNSLVRQDTPAAKQAQDRLRELWTKDVKSI